MASGPDLRPRTVGELLDGSFFLYRRHFGRFLILATIVSVPTLVIAGVTADMAGDALRGAVDSIWESIRHPERDPFKRFQQQLEINVQTQTWGMVSTILQALSRGGVTAVMAVATWAAVQRREVPGVWETLRRAAPRMPAAVLAFVAQSMLWVFVVCCLPVGVVAVAITAPIPAIVMFEVGPAERTALKSLPSGPLGKLLGVVVLPPLQVIDGTLRAFLLSWHAMTVVRGSCFVFFLTMFVSLFVSAASGVAGALLDSLAVIYWMQHYCEVLFLPVLGIGVTLWYLDLRVRREALDLFDAELTLA